MVTCKNGNSYKVLCDKLGEIKVTTLIAKLQRCCEANPGCNLIAEFGSNHEMSPPDITIRCDGSCLHKTLEK